VSAELLLLLSLALALAASLALRGWTRRRRARLGLAGGEIVFADDSLVRAPTLRSARLGLVGRCDHLLRVGDAYVPVEQKPSARRLQPSHVLQVGALCLLVADVYGVRPPYGVVVLAGGAQERVTFSEALERGVLRTMADMRRVLVTGAPPGPRWVAAKCRPCGHHPVCWDDEGTVAGGEHSGRARAHEAEHGRA
jgi:predicted RecB family nuclease